MGLDWALDSGALSEHAALAQSPEIPGGVTTAIQEAPRIERGAGLQPDDPEEPRRTWVKPVAAGTAVVAGLLALGLAWLALTSQ